LELGTISICYTPIIVKRIIVIMLLLWMPLEAFAISVSAHMLHADHASHTAPERSAAFAHAHDASDCLSEATTVATHADADDFATHDCDNCAVCHAKTAIPFLADGHKSADPSTPERVPLSPC
jgi:hypothetical protein